MGRYGEVERVEEYAHGEPQEAERRTRARARHRPRPEESSTASASVTTLVAETREKNSMLITNRNVVEPLQRTGTLGPSNSYRNTGEVGSHPLQRPEVHLVQAGALLLTVPRVTCALSSWFCWGGGPEE